VGLLLADDLGYMDSARTTETFYERRISTAWLPTACGSRPATPRVRCVRLPAPSIMTGKYPPPHPAIYQLHRATQRQTAAGPHQDHLALDEVTIAERLRDEGYTTFFAGKWALRHGPLLAERPRVRSRADWPGRVFYPPTKLGGAAGPTQEPTPKPTDRIAEEAVRFIEGEPRQAILCLPAVPGGSHPIGRAGHLVAKIRTQEGRGPPTPGDRSTGWQVRLVQNQPVYARWSNKWTPPSVACWPRSTLRAGQRTIVIFMSDNGGLCYGRRPTNVQTSRSAAAKGWVYEGGIREP